MRFSFEMIDSKHRFRKIRKNEQKFFDLRILILDKDAKDQQFLNCIQYTNLCTKMIKQRLINKHQLISIN